MSSPCHVNLSPIGLSGQPNGDWFLVEAPGGFNGSLWVNCENVLPFVLVDNLPSSTIALGNAAGCQDPHDIWIQQPNQPGVYTFKFVTPLGSTPDDCEEEGDCGSNCSTVTLYVEEQPPVLDSVEACQDTPCPPGLNLFTLAGLDCNNFDVDYKPGSPNDPGFDLGSNCNSGLGDFCPNDISPGTYSFRFTIKGADQDCVSCFRDMDVDIIEAPFTGYDTEVTHCISDGILNLFTALQSNPLNASGLTTNGRWTIITAPTDPINLCVGCPGSFSNLNLGPFPELLCASSHEARIDFSGTECSQSSAPEGQYIFRYREDDGCPSETFLTVNVLDSTVSGSFERTTTACLFSLFTENHLNPNTKRGDFNVTYSNLNLPAPNQHQNMAGTQAIGVRTITRQKYVRTPIEGPCVASDFKTSRIVYGGNANYSFGADVLPIKYNYNPANGIPANMLNPSFGNNTLGWAPNGLLIPFGRWRIEVGGFGSGFIINDMRLHKTPGTVIDLDLSSISCPSNSQPDVEQYALDIRSAIWTILASAPHNLNNTNILFDVQTGSVGFDMYLELTFFMRHNPSNTWVGINKDNWEICIEDLSTSDIECIDESDNDPNRLVFYETGVIDTLIFIHGYDFNGSSESPLTCSFYQDESGEDGGVLDAPLACFSKICTEDYTNIFNFNNCNYNNISLVSTENFAHLYNYDFPFCSAV
jgi:hypothetical protein